MSFDFEKKVYLDETESIISDSVDHFVSKEVEKFTECMLKLGYLGIIK